MINAQEQKEHLGVFYIDDDFLNTFSYNDEAPCNIDMDKLDYRETTKDYHYFKKKFPLFDDEIIEMLVELEIQQEKKNKVVNDVKKTINEQNNKKNKSNKKKKDNKHKFSIVKKSCVVNFD